MIFQLRPILSEIKELYAKPISRNRFTKYLSKLQGGTKGDLALPIMGYNPMAKEQVMNKIEELQSLGAEKIMQQTIQEFNSEIDRSSDDTYQVVLNLADDLGGAWTHFFTTDYESKFKLNAFVSRKFCAPYFWTSEQYTEEKIKIRTQEYLSRTLYCMDHPSPMSLEQHINQEVFVAEKSEVKINSTESLDFGELQNFLEKNRNSEAYDLIFNFFYGDEASASLGYQLYGIKKVNGYDFAKHLALSKTSLF